MSTISTFESSTPLPLAPRRRAAEPRIPSTRLGMWLFLASEVGSFGGMITTYVLMRLWHKEWVHDSAHTLLPVGTINTIVLLTSSLTMVLAHHAAEQRDRPATRRFLWITLGLGVLFLALKAFEYHHEIAEGHTPRAGVFWSFYFALTGLHALHIIGGLVMMLYLIARLKLDCVLARVAPIGLYWHFVDIVWIVLFPLMYVTAH
jgi:heme/copper-type cytochrome/quinol oxidase subunit 3